ATAISIPVNYGWAGATTVTLKALYTTERIFFLAQWKDPTLSDRRQPWKKVGDANTDNWVKIPAKLQDPASEIDAGWFFGTPENYRLRLSPPPGAAFEDKFAIAWGARDTSATVANVAGFKATGCAVLCHAIPGVGTSNDKKFTNSAGEVADVWQWKLIGTGAVGFVDDQYIDATRPSTATPEAGIKNDQPGDAYEDNTATAIADTLIPTWVSPDQPITTDTPNKLDPYCIPYGQKQVATTATLSALPAGSEIAGVLVKNVTGDRGEITAQKETTTAVGYDPSSTMWTLEFSRALITNSDTDVQFDDLQDTYYFGVAVFDNAQIEHSFHKGAYTLEFMPAATATFFDIEGHWAQEEIGGSATKGIVIGYPDGTFRPNNAVTRAEFIKVLMESLDVPQAATATPTFSDVRPGDWFFGYVEGAADASWITGYGNGTFRPNNLVSRQEAARVLVSALGIDRRAVGRSAVEMREVLSPFDETPTASAWAIPSIAEVTDRGAFIGYPDNTLRPRNNIARAETVVMANREIR
ncbi:MAG TPA: S-layer homology domain-containing protein, partial [Anaerolineae bacterium]|nr:S-layer homology domain-containing protein [Anaerolineae bacterium]